MTTLPLQLSEASGVPYYRQIVDQVSQLIRSGQLQPEQQLPSVRDLSGQLLVSLITTRRAYADLESAGLIQRRQGYGTFVAKEITMASHDQAVETTRNRLSEAVDEARRLGVDDEETRAIFDTLLGKEDTDVRS